MRDIADRLASADLLTRSRAGDSEAATMLVGVYLPRMRRWAKGRLPPAARELVDTEDVVQETLVAAIRNLDRIHLRTEGALQAYLRRALANRLTDAYRRYGATPPRGVLDSALPASSPSPLEEAIGHEALARYEQALGELAETDREAVILRIEMRCAYDEIAIALGKRNAAHARVAVSRALARLAQLMDHGV